MFCLPNQTNILSERAEVFELRKASGFRVHVEQADFRYIISFRPAFVSVKFNTSAFHFLAFALTGLLVMGCDSTGTSSEDPSLNEGGAVSFSLVRTANSDVPSDADSAFVRVWQPNGDFNLTEIVNIPDPGQQTEATLDVPADQGYRAGILAVDRSSGRFSSGREILAHGSSGTLTVQTDDTNQVTLDVRPARLTLKRPESIAPNRTDTVTMTYSINPSDLGEVFTSEQSSSSNFDYGSGSDLNRVSGSFSETDTTISESFEIVGPNVDTESTTYVKVKYVPSPSLNDPTQWVPGDRALGNSYFPSENDSSFEIPVVPGSGDGSGTIIITFLRDGDGWEETHRTIE